MEVIQLGINDENKYISYSISSYDNCYFGGTFTMRYFRTTELLLDQIIGASIGIILIIAR